jgi:hypothetical protein
MTPDIADGLEQLIAAIETRRASMERCKRELLKGGPTVAAYHELVALKTQLDHLRLAEDVLSDALSALARIEEAAKNAA